MAYWTVRSKKSVALFADQPSEVRDSSLLRIAKGLSMASMLDFSKDEQHSALRGAGRIGANAPTFQIAGLELSGQRVTSRAVGPLKVCPKV